MTEAKHTAPATGAETEYTVNDVLCIKPDATVPAMIDDRNLALDQAAAVLLALSSPAIKELNDSDLYSLAHSGWCAVDLARELNRRIERRQKQARPSS